MKPLIPYIVILVLAILAILAVSTVCAVDVYADGPWGHAPNHGYTGVDVTKHLLSPGTGFWRCTDGSCMWVSHSTPNSYNATVSFHNADGSVRTAYPVKTPQKLNRCLHNQCAKGNYVMTDISPAERAKWAAQGLSNQAGGAVMNATPPLIPVVPGWMSYCLPGEVLSACQYRILGTTTG